jgi:haloalkane dehalogenase
MLHRRDAPELPDWIERMLPFERYTVGVEGRQMHVMEAGEGRAVVMLHGNPTWGFLWRKVASVLGSGYRVVVPDLVGLGLSDKPRDDSAHTLENHARWVATLLAGLELEDFIFVGQDWGGPIGLLASARGAAKPAGMVILNTAFAPPRDDFRPTAFHRFANTPLVSDLAFRALEFPQSMLWTAQGDWDSVDERATRAYRYPLRNPDERAAPLALARMVPDSLDHPSVPPLQEVYDFITSFEGPMAAVWGDADPVLGRVGRFFEKTFPDVPLLHTSAGHFLQEEVPFEIAEAIHYVDSKL